MQIVIGCDNAAVSLKNTIIALLKTKNVEIEDVGCFTSDDPTYYPLGGMCMTANKFKGIRAAVCHDIFSTERSILSNNGNVLCMGERVIGAELAKTLVSHWLELTFKDGPSTPKVQAIIDIENENMK